MENNRKKLLSIILLSYYSNERIETCYSHIANILAQNDIPFEFIIMDDDSKDNSYRLALELEKSHENVHAYQLSRNFTSHYSIFAGLSVCNGACAMPIVDDEQQPYQTIVDMYRLWEHGNKIIIPYRISREDPIFSRVLSTLYYKIMNKLSDISYPLGGADLFFADREVIDIINTRIHPINTSSISEVLRLGFNPYFYGYMRPLGLNKNKSRWTFKKKLRLAKDNFFSASTFPIKMINMIGFWSSLLAISLMLFYIYIAIWGNRHFWGVKIPGWTSIILFVILFGGLIMLSLGIIAEYIWRIYEEVKGRPGYIIKKKDSEHDLFD